MQVDEYIAKVDPKLRPQLAKLASTVRKALPEAAEAVRRGVPYWAVNKVGVVSIAEYRRHVNLYFLKGASLSSPPLEGTGTSMRRITARTLSDIDERESSGSSRSRVGWPQRRPCGGPLARGRLTKRLSGARAWPVQKRLHHPGEPGRCEYRVVSRSGEHS